MLAGVVVCAFVALVRACVSSIVSRYVWGKSFHIDSCLHFGIDLGELPNFKA